MSKLSGIDYLMFKIRGRIVKVDPDIYYKIRNPGHEEPRKKYNGDIKVLTISSAGYPVLIIGTKPCRHLQLSRFVMNAEKGEIVDHINGDPLDNRRKNLRIVNSRQNNLNRRVKSKTGFFGVYLRHWRERTYCYSQFHAKDGKLLFFHLPDNPHNRILAAFARDKFILQEGEEEYAPLNFPCFKFEPFRSFLLEEDLKKYKKNRGPDDTLAPAARGGVFRQLTINFD
ncbi:MAG: HNH endonuclease [Phycisphaerae bacterium]|jgi:hypothetical protein